MPQYPIPAQAFARAPSKNPMAILCDANGLLLVAGGSSGDSIFVNEATGSDSTGDGSPNKPFATLDAGLAEATANNDDTVYLMGTSHRTAVLNWSKNGVNLVGLLAPSDNDRARISQTGSTAFANLVNVTGVGCRFENIATFHGFNDASAQICWQDLGGRNYYKNTQFLGMGDATAAAQAGSRSLILGGAGEFLLEDCTFGLDTIVRATNPNATLEVVGGAPRIVIRRGVFQADVTDVSDVHIKVGAGGLDRYLYLDGCFLHNFGTAMDAAITNAGGSPGGNVVLSPNCSVVGATAVATTGNVFVSGPVPTGATSSLAVLAT